MTFDSEVWCPTFPAYSEFSRPLFEHHPVGICEVVTVAPTDELPYVFELAAGQKLSFSVSASQDIDVILCDERAYDEWVDDGLQLEHPPSPILALRHGRQHALEFRLECDTTLVAILINLAISEVHAVVAATVLDSAGKAC